LLDHLVEHYGLYGEYSGVRTARKHIGWYVRGLPDGEAFRARMNTIEDSALQWRAVSEYFEALASHTDRMPSPGKASIEADDEEAVIAAD